MFLLAFTGVCPVKPSSSPTDYTHLLGMHFKSACEGWLKDQWGQLSERTMLDYSRYLLIYAEIFPVICQKRGIDYAGLKIEKITAQLMRDYQNERDAAWNTINHELTVLSKCRADMRLPIEGYRLLRKPQNYKSPGRRLESDEKEQWIKICKEHADHPRWGVAALASLVQLSSGIGPGELKSVQLENVTLGDEPAIYIPPAGAKRKRRIRMVELEDEGAWALQKLYERAVTLGCKKPHHYLLPGQRSRGDKSYDPMKMCGSWKQGMKALLDIAKTRFRNYDQRHHAISEALQDPRISLTAASQHFGHISERMRDLYYHGSRETSRQVARAISERTFGKPRRKPVQRAADSEAQGSFTYSNWSPKFKK